MSSNLVVFALIVGSLALLALFAGSKAQVPCCENPAHNHPGCSEIGYCPVRGW
jgi:hypothetical protein